MGIERAGFRKMPQPQEQARAQEHGLPPPEAQAETILEDYSAESVFNKFSLLKSNEILDLEINKMGLSPENITVEFMDGIDPKNRMEILNLLGDIGLALPEVEIDRTNVRLYENIPSKAPGFRKKLEESSTRVKESSAKIARLLRDG
jgi:hypothetical protein